jgi:hypothetical protein
MTTCIKFLRTENRIYGFVAPKAPPAEEKGTGRFGGKSPIWHTVSYGPTDGMASSE